MTEYIKKNISFQGTYSEIIIQCPKDDTTELCEALRQTQLIDWSITSEVPFTPAHLRPSIKAIIAEKNVK